MSAGGHLSRESLRELAEGLVLPSHEIRLGGLGSLPVAHLPAELREKMERGHAGLCLQAREAFIDGNAMLLVASFSNEYGLRIVLDNAAALLKRGIYEECLVNAYTMTRTNWAGWPLSALTFLLDLADRDKLLRAGDPLPEGEAFTLYRGVAGKGARRKVAGFSWTRSHEAAAWFAMRFADHLPDPAVYEAKVRRSEVFFYSNARSEDDFILRARRCRRLGDEVLAEGEKFRGATA